jgi:hypothetical protein
MATSSRWTGLGECVCGGGGGKGEGGGSMGGRAAGIERAGVEVCVCAGPDMGECLVGRQRRGRGLGVCVWGVQREVRLQHRAGCCRGHAPPLLWVCLKPYQRQHTLPWGLGLCEGSCHPRMGAAANYMYTEQLCCCLVGHTCVSRAGW